MLLTVLTLLLTQLPATPQVLVPGGTYDAELLEPIRGAEAVELCDGTATATTVQLLGRRDDYRRTVAPSTCESPVLFVGSRPVPGERISSARFALDRVPGETILQLEEARWRLQWRPYSDGGIRVTLIAPEGDEHTLFESAAPGATLEVLWAGDLNGDQRLDLVVEASEGFSPFLQLLISDQDGLTHLVAETLVAMR